MALVALPGSSDAALVKGPSRLSLAAKGTVGSLVGQDRDLYPIDTVFYVKPKAPIGLLYHLLQTLGLEGDETLTQPFQVSIATDTYRH